ncbi:MAG: hypothetical protein HPY71_15275 [Firmicutes bacterium]|nr:hypothetical protein [Bacillota bacterium]
MRFWRFFRNTLVALAIFWALGYINTINTPVAQRVRGYVVYALTAEVDFKASLDTLRDLAMRFLGSPGSNGIGQTR